jgi:hypothetical protein
MAMKRSVIDLQAAPWVPMGEAFARRGGRGNAEMKLLTAPDGRRVGLVHLDGEGMPHFHTKPSSFFILDGTMELRDRIAGPGTWAIEPYGAIHPHTRFHDVTYGLGMAEGDFGVGNVVLDRVEDAPEWVAQAGFNLGDYSTLVDTRTIAWLPFGDGLSIKVLHVFDGRGAFAALLRAEAGARLPPRRYLGPADLYILSGRVEFADAVALPGAWVHQPAGAEDAAAAFPTVTEFLANTYGTILEFDAHGSITRIIDGFALRDLAHVRTDGATGAATLSDAELQRALARFTAISSPQAMAG